jgi:hypothetical protein
MRSMFASFADLSRIFDARLFIIAIVLTFAVPAYCDAKSIARHEIPVELREANGQDMQSSAAPLSSLRGAVINSVTREPVARALVFSPDNRFAIFTDDRGRFEFQLSRIDSVQLMARKPGFLEGGSAGPYQPQSAADDMTIALIPESLIVGRVNLPSSNQFDRITVEVYKRQVRDGRPFWAPVASVTTRSNGEFRVANLRAGIYKIFTDELLDRDPITFDPRGQLYGYPPIYYPAASDFASASAIALEAGKAFQVELTPVLQPYYRIKIAVTNIEAGSALNVSVALHGHRGPGYSLGYAGESSIEGMLPNGTYTVEASVQQGQQTANGSLNINVRDAPLTHASMTVIPGGSIPVNIRDEQSEKSRQSSGSMTYGKFSRETKADVSLQPADEFDWTGFATLRLPRKPHDNDLVLDSVRPGRYWLQVNPYFGYAASAVAGSVDLLRQPLVVGPGGASLPIDIVLRDDGATIDGTVEGMPAPPVGGRGTANAGPVPVPVGAYVYCIPLPDSSGRFTVSGISAEGTFQFQQLPPGAYRVLAFDRQQDELEYRNAEVMNIYEDKGPVVRLVAGQTEQVRVPLISTKE